MRRPPQPVTLEFGPFPVPLRFEHRRAIEGAQRVARQRNLEHRVIEVDATATTPATIAVHIDDYLPMEVGAA